ncbi:hypothetical protein BOVMAS37_18770 [Streptococcus uberis]
MTVGQNEVRSSDKSKANDLGFLLSNRPWNKEIGHDIIAIGTTKYRLSKGGGLPHVGNYISKHHRTNSSWDSACTVF